MEPSEIVVRITDGHTNKSRCADCRKYKAKYFFIHLNHNDDEWIKFLHDPTAGEPFMTEVDSRNSDVRKLLFEGQPPIKLTSLNLNEYPEFILSFIDRHFGRKSRIFCSVWTIKP